MPFWSLVPRVGGVGSGPGARQDWGSGQCSEGWVEIVYREVTASVTPGGGVWIKSKSSLASPRGVGVTAFLRFLSWLGRDGLRPWCQFWCVGGPRT